MSEESKHTHHHTHTHHHHHHKHFSRRREKQKWAKKMAALGGVCIVASLYIIMLVLYGSSGYNIYPHILYATPVFFVIGILGGLVVYYLICKEQKKEGM